MILALAAVLAVAAQDTGRIADAQAVFGFESVEIGKRWGTRLALDVMKDLIDAGLMPGLGH